MYFLEKIKDHGMLWFIQRIVRELITPSTKFGRSIRYFSFFIYYLVSLPLNYSCYLINGFKTQRNCLYFFYDFEVEPITFDFAWALCIANAKRVQLGLPRLCVVFVPGFAQGLRKEPIDYEKVVTRNAREWRISCILLPIIQLLPFPISILFCTTRKEAMLIRQQQAQFVYPEKYNVTFPIPYSPEQGMFYRENLLALKADNQALTYISDWISTKQMNAKKMIVITLRQYAYQQERNSNISAWLQFANQLDREQFFVVFIPDTEQALTLEPREFREFNLFYPACWNLKLRAAIYELAYLNLGVNTGPMSLCWLSTRCRYITFKTIVKNGPQSAIDVLVGRGYVPGHNPLFTTSFQKWVWEEDDFDILCREFWLMYDLIEGNGGKQIC